MFIQVHLANVEAGTCLPYQIWFGLFLCWATGHWKERSFSSKSAGSCTTIVCGVSRSPANRLWLWPFFYSEGGLISPPFGGTAVHVAPTNVAAAVHITPLKWWWPSLKQVQAHEGKGNGVGVATDEVDSVNNAEPIVLYISMTEIQ